MTTMLEAERVPIGSGALDRRTQGASSPLGATPGRGGVNFSVFSKYATAVELLLFDHVDDPRAARVIRIDPASRTYHYWHVFVPGVIAGQIYGYRAAGPWDPANGMRFDPSKVLLDPYGRGVAVPNGYGRDAAGQPGDNAATAMKSVVIDSAGYDWEGDALPAGQGQLLGLCAGLVLRAASGVQLAPGPAGPDRRVPRPGQGAAPGRHRGHPRRRVQPYRGRG